MMNPIINNNSLYDKLKFIAQVVLPGLATLYFALSQVWGLSYGPEVVATITALNTFLGVVLGISNRQYNSGDSRFDGTIDVIDVDDTKRFMLNLDADPYDLHNKQEVLFKVNDLGKDE